jgi:hypothetical protein
MQTPSGEPASLDRRREESETRSDADPSPNPTHHDPGLSLHRHDNFNTLKN